MEDKKNYYKILEKLRGKRVGIFCDGANLFHGRQKYGWHIFLEDVKNEIILE